MAKLEVKTSSQLLSAKWFALNQRMELKAKVVADRIANLNGKEKLALDLEDEKRNKYTLVLNSSNTKFLMENGFEDSSELKGHEITITLDPTIKFMGKTTGGIRITEVQ